MPPPQQQLHVKAAPYSWPHDGSFSRATTALVLIDMQRDFCSPGGYLDYQGYDIGPIQALVPKLQKLLWAWRDAGWQVYHTREGHRPDLSTLSPRELFRSRNNARQTGIGSPGPLGRLLIRGEPGHDTIPALYPLPLGEPVIDKPGKGAFAHTDFELLLRNRGIRNLVLAGVTTDVCVSTTMREAADRGVDCLLVVDGCAASEEVLHAATAEGVRMEGGVFGATGGVEDVISALKESVRREKEGEVEGIRPGEGSAVVGETVTVRRTASGGSSGSAGSGGSGGSGRDARSIRTLPAPATLKWDEDVGKERERRKTRSASASASRSNSTREREGKRREDAGPAGGLSSMPLRDDLLYKF